MTLATKLAMTPAATLVAILPATLATFLAEIQAVELYTAVMAALTTILAVKILTPPKTVSLRRH